MIRSEKREDIKAVRELNLAAFPTPAEANLVDKLRSQIKGYISLVYMADQTVTGHIFFSPVTIENNPKEISVCGLAPMAVLPKFQKQGIGGKLVNAGFKIARENGYQAVVVLGHPNYYPRFGFKSATNFNLRCEFDVPEEAFMALELKKGSINHLSGTVRYHSLFREV